MRRVPRTAVILLAAIAGGLVPPGASASAAGPAELWRAPLLSRNQFPIFLLFLVPEPERAAVLGPGRTSLDFDLSLSNIIKTSHAPASPSADHLILDYEWWRAQARFELGLGRAFQASASLPFYDRSGGFLDPFISRFHRTFGFPNAVRSQTPDYLFRYELVLNGARVLGPVRRGLVVGDLVLSLKKAWYFSGSEVALRGLLKAPTGAWEDAAGSGAWDFGLGFLVSGVGRRAGYYLNAGYCYLGRPKVPGLVARDYFFGLAGFDLLLGRRLALVVQVDYVDRMVDSSIPILDRPSGQLTAGFRWEAGSRLALEFRLTEDLASASPDFTFGLRLEIRGRSDGGAKPLEAPVP
jgi:hypothetical protein